VNKTTMTRPAGRQRLGALTLLVALAALLALAPSVEAASYAYYRTSWGSFPVVYQSWGYWLTRLTRTPAPAPAPGTYQPSAAEKQAVDLINADRAKNGLPALALNPSLTRVAHLKAQDMAVNGYFDHTSPTYGSPFDMMIRFGITYRAAGENIAKAGSVSEAETLFMQSSGHRANILSPTYTQVGVGIYAGADGMTYESQMFILP
jgi:uncharacterized YkwD family protein